MAEGSGSHGGQTGWRHCERYGCSQLESPRGGISVEKVREVKRSKVMDGSEGIKSILLHCLFVLFCFIELILCAYAMLFRPYSKSTVKQVFGYTVRNSTCYQVACLHLLPT